MFARSVLKPLGTFPMYVPVDLKNHVDLDFEAGRLLIPNVSYVQRTHACMYTSESVPNQG